MPSGKHQKKPMYDLQYVKKRKRRRAAAFISLVSAIGITSFITISFFTGRVGSFSVSVANQAVKLSLGEKMANFNAGTGTSYLRLDDVKPFQEYHYKDLPDPEVLDNELTAYDDARAIGLDKDGNPECMYYVKYTFFVKNFGNQTAHYELFVNLSDRNKTRDGTERSLDDTLRVMLFENDGNTDEHEYKVYAKAAAGNNRLRDGTITNQEFVGYNSIGGQEDDQHPLAETFSSADVICTRDVSNFRKNEVKRYTVVFWLEGEDPQSNTSDEAPEDAKLKLGVEIRAYEEK